MRAADVDERLVKRDRFDTWCHSAQDVPQPLTCRCVEIMVGGDKDSLGTSSMCLHGRHRGMHTPKARGRIRGGGDNSTVRGASDDHWPTTKGGVLQDLYSGKETVHIKVQYVERILIDVHPWGGLLSKPYASKRFGISDANNTTCLFGAFPGTTERNHSLVSPSWTFMAHDCLSLTLDRLGDSRRRHWAQASPTCRRPR